MEPEDDPRIAAAEWKRDHDDEAADRAADRYERSLDR